MNKFQQIGKKFWKAKRLDLLEWVYDNRYKINSIVSGPVRYSNIFANEQFMRCLESK
ncbi:hypothetical protein DICPUDRAFT_157948 [Dictyostelium purpureum]|uniref:Uncharacterized protein n=1 Tax=Dictyostelium purpureum TaxID=5786 RepID=F1A0F3_DICPU|nr:uncharacterized protein DICPUDRAFT_157947 [Dictyostelium purpureum]XP_003293146.1 uncharacterized protein DICPUDRAFT_157948 [Dictyostelium purpureum]EGC30322.1 hypothetical protein DICPUDRAFT_157947 [Dictyostelium purpureum]EGC30323.1 hypothetical protein DICPUDRAFT_157948 [Dictyostelium purpureum]|eukprot:XP_003293145.1 hypothetical protein DICPUDRAFT_157947 [Dictyostelium purpureum]